jgi:hypothetical protein
MKYILCTIKCTSYVHKNMSTPKSRQNIPITSGSSLVHLSSQYSQEPSREDHYTGHSIIAILTAPTHPDFWLFPPYSNVHLPGLFIVYKIFSHHQCGSALSSMCEALDSIPRTTCALMHARTQFSAGMYEIISNLSNSNIL